MRTAPAIAGRQHGVFTVGQALQHGWTHDALRNAVRQGNLIRIHRGCYSLRLEPASGHLSEGLSSLRSAVAAALSISASSVSHQSASVHYGLPTFFPNPDGCVTIPAGLESRASRIHLHRLHLPAEHRRGSGAFAVTTPARTCLDIACESGAGAGIIAADAALRAGLASRDELEEAYAHLYGVPGSVAARQVAQSAEGRSESPLESLSRLTFQDAEMLPQIQQWICHASGALVGRVDFLWPELGVVGEADGKLKYAETARNPLWDEKQRQERLADLGLVVVRWTWREALHARVLLEKIERAHAQARQLRLAGIPARYGFGPDIGAIRWVTTPISGPKP